MCLDFWHLVSFLSFYVEFNCRWANLLTFFLIYTSCFDNLPPPPAPPRGFCVSLPFVIDSNCEGCNQNISLSKILWSDFDRNSWIHSMENLLFILIKEKWIFHILDDILCLISRYVFPCWLFILVSLFIKEERKSECTC